MTIFLKMFIQPESKPPTLIQSYSYSTGTQSAKILDVTQ